ncbi:MULTISPECIES: C40 family peptidase [Nocardioides]|uniref:C40 family peptidase n=1 Tax=Nocardioides TaxID=1839 RepID=UPI00040F1A50|nr:MULTISPECIES: C40 family peptidase [Nocardioides]
MPAIRRMARSCALTIVTLGVTATTVAVAPAHAADSQTTRSGAVALSDSQVTKYDKTMASRRQRSAQRLSARISSAQQTAMAQRGDAYSYGAAGPNAFDCSGLIYYSYRGAGFDVPRTSGAQAAHTRRISKQDMRPGDLMFFFNSGGVYHAAIFIGYQNGHAMMVHAPGSGQRVTVAAPWTSSWFAGTLR